MSSLLTGSSNQMTPELVEHGADAAGLAAGVAAVGVDHQLDVVAGEFAQLAHAVRGRGRRRLPQASPILIFIAVHPASRPAVDLLGELVVVQSGESAGAVDGHGCRGPDRTDRASGDVEQPGLEVPQGDVDGARSPA